MPLTVPAPWTCITDVAATDPLRFRLAWKRIPAPDQPEIVVGVVMYNPAMEGSTLPDGSTLDGATHRRVRALLSYATEIRVANLSPVRTTKPAVARQACKALTGAEDQEQADALAWACKAPVVVAAWGASARTPRMAWSLSVVRMLARDRLWCWGTTPAGEPLHPSPLGRVRLEAKLVRYAQP